MQTGSHSFISRQNLIEDAIAYIEDNLQDTLSVPQLAAQIYLSPDYFRKVFKEATGLSPIVYINSRRLAQSK